MDELQSEIEQILQRDGPTMYALVDLHELYSNLASKPTETMQMFYNATRVVAEEALPDHTFTGNAEQVIEQIFDVARERKSQEISQYQTERFKNILGSGFYIEFTEGDLKEIQETINQLRDLLTASEMFEDEH